MNFKLIVLLAICVMSSGVDAKEETKYAAVIYSNGECIPVNQIDNLNFNESMWPVKMGQLTNTGKMQHYELGKYLRARYNELIAVNYDHGEISVRSAYADRTWMSAATNLAGMFPPVEESVWNPNVNWQPIPILAKPEDEDEVLAMGKECPNHNTERTLVKGSSGYMHRLAKYKTVMSKISTNAGIRVEDYDDVLSVYKILKVAELHNFTLPGWATSVYPGQMAELAGISYTTDTATPLMARFKIGPFLKELIANMGKMINYNNAKIQSANDVDGTPPLKINIYSAHDYNIANILNGLGMFDGEPPEFTSSIMFELVYDDSNLNYFIKVLYKNNTDNTKDPVVLNIPNCGLRCPFEQFRDQYAHLLPGNWGNECTKRAPMSFGASLMLVSVYMTCLFIYFTWEEPKCCRRH